MIINQIPRWGYASNSRSSIEVGLSDHSLTFGMTSDGDYMPGSTRDAVYRDITCVDWCWLKDNVRGVAGGHMTDLTPHVESSRCYDNKQVMIKNY